MVRTRSAQRVESTEKAIPTKTPGVRVTADDSTHCIPVETCHSLEQGASTTSAISSTKKSATSSCPVVQSEADSCSSTLSFGSSRRKTRRPCDNSSAPSDNQRVTRSRALALAKNSNEVLESSSKTRAPSGNLDDSNKRSKRSKKKLFNPVDELAEELTDMHSPVSSLCSTQGGATPCSSRTGSGYSSCGAPSTSSSVRGSTVYDEDAVEPVKQDEASNPSSIPADNSQLTATASDDPVWTSEAANESAMMSKDQQVEPPDEYASKTELVHFSPELSQPSQPVGVMICERALEITVDTEEMPQDVDVADVDAHTAQSISPVHEAAVVETKPSAEISTVTGDSQEMVDLYVSAFHLTPDQQNDIKAGAVPEKPKVVSLLDSSDEDEEDQEKLEVSEEERGKSAIVSAVSVDGLFVIDTRPGSDVDDQYYNEGPQGEEAGTSKAVEEEDDEFVDEEGDDEDDEDEKALASFSRSDSYFKDLSSSIDPGIKVKDLGGLYVTFDGSSSKPSHSSSHKQKIHDDVMKKTVIGPEFEKKDAVPLKLKRKAEREKSTGQAWFNMKSPELTQELKGDLQVLKMRGSLDQKRFYKKNDMDGFPKFFQLGTVEDSPIDYHSRIPKKKRKSTMVEELLADAEFRQNNKKKYQHILSERAASFKKKKTNH